MSLPIGDAAKAVRLALLEPERVEIPHPTVKGYVILGYVIRPDEMHEKGDGPRMLLALERLAGIRWRFLRRGLLKRA